MKNVFSRSWKWINETQERRFVANGPVATVTYFIPYYLLTEMLGLKYYILAASIASVVSSTINFFMQKYWVFNDRRPGKFWLQAIMFAVVSREFTVANLAMLGFLVSGCKLNYLVSQAIITCVLFVASRFISGKIIFQDTNTKP